MTATDIADFPALKDARGKLQAKQDELGSIFAEAGPDLDLSKVKSISGATDTKSVAEHITNLNDECSDLMKQVESLLGVQKAAQLNLGRGESGDRSGVEPGAGALGGGSTKSFGDLFWDSEARLTKGASSSLDIDVKTLMTTAAGWAPEVTRTGKIVDMATRPIQILDLIPTTTTGQAGVKYMEETTFTNAAQETAEGGTYQEAALALTERLSPVQKVAVFLPVTDEELEDEPRARGYINNRLPFMVRQRLDGQVIVGNGTAPNLRGVLNVAGIQTQAKGTDPVPDAVYKALVLARVNGRAIPDAFVTNPLDWQDVRLLRTADGIYIWGNPSEAGPERIWGLNVAQSDAITQNTGLVGDFSNYSELSMRRGIDVQVSNSHSTFFIEGKQAIRADLRAAFIVYRPAAFVTVTGI
jgi:HK97 family phage major capsid protein